MARRRMTWCVVAATALLAGPLHADPAGVVKESGRTAGEAVVGGAKTVGRTIRDFFTRGPRTAGETWRENAHETGANTRDRAGRVREEAHDER